MLFFQLFLTESRVTLKYNTHTKWGITFLGSVKLWQNVNLKSKIILKKQGHFHNHLGVVLQILKCLFAPYRLNFTQTPYLMTHLPMFCKFHYSLWSPEKWIFCVLCSSISPFSNCKSIYIRTRLRSKVFSLVKILNKPYEKKTKMGLKQFWVKSIFGSRKNFSTKTKYGSKKF